MKPARKFALGVALMVVAFVVGWPTRSIESAAKISPAMAARSSAEDRLPPPPMLPENPCPRQVTEAPLAFQATPADEKDPEIEAANAVRALSESGNLLEYCGALAEGEWKQRVLRHAALAQVPADPRSAIMLAQRMDDSPARTDALQTAVYDWMTRDAVIATHWIGSVDDPALREALQSAAAKAIAASDPELAATWIATALKDEGAQRETALCVVEAWTAREPAAAAAWVARFPVQLARDAAIDLIAREWRRVDRAAFESWFAGLPDRAEIRARWRAEAEAARATEMID